MNIWKIHKKPKSLGIMRVLLWRLRACTGWRRRTTRRRRGWRRSCTAGMCCSRRSRARWPTSPSRSWRRGAAPTASPCPTRSARGQRGPAQEPRERLWMRREWSGRPGPPAGLPRALLQVGSSGSGTARLRVLCEKRFYGDSAPDLCGLMCVSLT